MSSFGNLRRLLGGAPMRNNYPRSSAIETPVVSPESHPPMFGPARVRKWVSGDDVSGFATRLEVRLPFQSGSPELGTVRLLCTIGGLSGQVEELVVSADAITATIRVPNGIELQRPTLIVLTWFSVSVLLQEVTLTIQSAR